MPRKILKELKDKKLPQMVDWYNPGLLAKIGVREVISSVMGQYADQRLLQAATDRASEEELSHRYDYSNPENPDELKRLTPDGNGALWIDYIADLGDGFEPTFAMASLLSAESLDLGDVGHLRHGEVLIMGGDQAYPQASREEYRDRLQDPYDMAFTADDQPERKLFALPGNHDWYDGLNAFDNLFCSARDRSAHGKGTRIGGWQCMQHRSYFAIELPHNWWIWGADIQFSNNLDDGQINYFDLISEQMGPEDKVIICIAEPSWLEAEAKGYDEHENLNAISMLARKTGAQICAVMAGDWHHYSRYHSEDLGIHFITCGGGGAFAHATHQLKNKLTVHWPVATKTGESSDDSLAFDKAEKRVLKGDDDIDFKAQDFEISVEDDASSASTKNDRPRPPNAKRLLGKAEPFDHEKPSIYPSRLTSRLLSLRNFALPFHNFSFALGLGFIYFIYSWMAFGIDEEIQYFQGSFGTDATYEKSLIWFVYLASQKSIAFFLLVIGLWVGLVKYVDTSVIKWKFLRPWIAAAFGTAHFVAHLLTIAIMTIIVNGVIYNVAKFHHNFETSEASTKLKQEIRTIERFQYNTNKAFITTGSYTKDPDKLMNQKTKTISRLQKIEAQREKDLFAGYRILGALLLIPIGGILGALVFGTYWVFTCSLFSMHCGDAFGALMIKDYNHFLRMKFEKDKLTIYPIGLNRVPRARGWVEPSAAGKLRPNKPKIVPKKPLKIHLIEDPIVIHAKDTM